MGTGPLAISGIEIQRPAAADVDRGHHLLADLVNNSVVASIGATSGLIAPTIWMECLDPVYGAEG
jgi:hypothetical protein